MGEMGLSSMDCFCSVSAMVRECRVSSRPEIIYGRFVEVEARVQGLPQSLVSKHLVSRATEAQGEYAGSSGAWVVRQPYGYVLLHQEGPRSFSTESGLYLIYFGTRSLTNAHHSPHVLSCFNYVTTDISLQDLIDESPDIALARH